MKKFVLNRVVGYIRVSTEEQVDSGAGLEAQRSAIREECGRRGWELVEIVADEGVSGAKPLNERPGGLKVLEMLETRKADGMVVAKLDRATRSVMDLPILAGGVRRWAFVALDFGLDTTTPAGELVLINLVGAGQFERRMIGLRTREGLAVKRAQGVRLGRPPETAPDVEAYVVALRRSGTPLRAIAEQLATEGVPCAQGGSWHVSTVRRILGRHASELPTFRRGPRPAVQPT